MSLTTLNTDHDSKRAFPSRMARTSYWMAIDSKILYAGRKLGILSSEKSQFQRIYRNGEGKGSNLSTLIERGEWVRRWESCAWMRGGRESIAMVVIEEEWGFKDSRTRTRNRRPRTRSLSSRLRVFFPTSTCTLAAWPSVYAFGARVDLFILLEIFRISGVSVSAPKKDEGSAYYTRIVWHITVGPHK